MQAHAHARTQMHVHAILRTRTHACTCKGAAHSRTHAARTYTHSHALARSQTRTRARTHAHTHTDTQPQTHTHTAFRTHSSDEPVEPNSYRTQPPQPCFENASSPQDYTFKIDSDRDIKALNIANQSLNELLAKAPLSDRLQSVIEQVGLENCGKPQSSQPTTDKVDVKNISLNVADSGEEADEAEMCIDLHGLDDPEGKLQKWRLFAQNMVARHVTLVVDPESSTAVADLLRKSAITKLNGTPGENYIIVMYDSALAGEASARPHLRIVSFRDNHLQSRTKRTK